LPTSTTEDRVQFLSSLQAELTVIL